LNLRSKLLVAFLSTLVLVLVLILHDYVVERQQLSDHAREEQLRTSQAIAAAVDYAVEDIVSIARSVSAHTTFHAMEPAEVDLHLRDLTRFLPQVDILAVYDATGRRISSAPSPLSAEDPLPVAVRQPMLERAMSTGEPLVSAAVLSRPARRPAILAAVPVMWETGDIAGVVVAASNVDNLVQRLAAVELGPLQGVFVTDPDGKIVFHTLLPREEWGSRAFADHPTVREALTGAQASQIGVPTPLGDERIVAAVPTPKYGWVAGASAPVGDVLGPLESRLVTRLIVYGSLFLLASLLAVSLSHRLVISPLEALTDHLRAFGRGEAGRRITLRTGDEMQVLAEAFNEMAAQLEERGLENERLLNQTVDANRRLEEARQLRERFVSMVVHELRGPLSVLIGYGQIVSQSLREGRAVNASSLDRILSQAGQMRMLIEDLSDLSRIEAGRFDLDRAPCDLGMLAREIAANHQVMTGKHTIVVEAPPEPVLGEWDCERLAQVINNLVSNALKYSPRGGKVGVSVTATGDSAVVTVSDQGVGLEPEEVPQLFLPFSRLRGTGHIKGTGLGLYVAKTIVDAHGGRIWVESSPGRGSTFSFALPTSSA
jgi:signal transduction histidine kinase